MGGHSILLGIFPAQGSNLGLAHCKQIHYNLSHQGSLICAELFHCHSFSNFSSHRKYTRTRWNTDSNKLFSWGTNHQKIQTRHHGPSGKNRFNVDCFHFGLHMLISLFVHFLWFAANFLSYFTKALIKLLIKHLFWVNWKI